MKMQDINQVRAEVIALVHQAPAEQLFKIKRSLLGPDAEPEVALTEDNVVGYAGTQTITVAELQRRAMRVDAARANGELLNTEDIRARLSAK